MAAAIQREETITLTKQALPEMKIKKGQNGHCRGNLVIEKDITLKVEAGACLFQEYGDIHIEGSLIVEDGADFIQYKRSV